MIPPSRIDLQRFARGYAVDAHDMHAATTYDNLQT